jgi:8-oxo-dGTP pyrophosphatase MutT (NUDIX family)
VHDFAERLTARLAAPLPGAEAHAIFSPRRPKQRPIDRPIPADARRAAVLILLYPNGIDSSDARHPSGLADIASYSVPLTLRGHDLDAHPGQISLPGGAIDPGETDVAAALREAEEEIGVSPSSVRVIGALTPLYVIVSRFVIQPFVAVVPHRPDFRPDVREVAEIIEVPLPLLLDAERVQWNTRSRDGFVLEYPFLHVGPPPHHELWGATAMVLSEFAAVVRGL